MNTDTVRAECLHDDSPVRRCTAAAGSLIGRGVEVTVRHVAFWTAIAFPAVYVVGSLVDPTSVLPGAWLPLAIATNLLLLLVGHRAHHPE